MSASINYTFRASDWIIEFIVGGLILIGVVVLFYLGLRTMALLTVIYAALIMWLWIGYRLMKMGGVRWPPIFQECPDYMIKTDTNSTGFSCTHRFMTDPVSGSPMTITFQEDQNIEARCRSAQDRGLTWDGC